VSTGTGAALATITGQTQGAGVDSTGKAVQGWNVMFETTKASMARCSCPSPATTWPTFTPWCAPRRQRWKGCSAPPSSRTDHGALVQLPERLGRFLHRPPGHADQAAGRLHVQHSMGNSRIVEDIITWPANYASLGGLPPIIDEAKISAWSFGIKFLTVGNQDDINSLLLDMTTVELAALGILGGSVGNIALSVDVLNSQVAGLEVSTSGVTAGWVEQLVEQAESQATRSVQQRGQLQPAAVQPGDQPR